MSDILRTHAWCLSTTVRNPIRLIGFLEAIAPLDGREHSKQTMMDVQIHAIMAKVYRPSILTECEAATFDDDSAAPFGYAHAKEIFDRQRYQDPPMRGRQTLNPLCKLNWVTYDAVSGLRVTPIGKRALSGDISVEQLLLASLIDSNLPFKAALELMYQNDALTLDAWKWSLPFSGSATYYINLREDIFYCHKLLKGGVNENTLRDYADNLLRCFTAVGLVVQDSGGKFKLNPKHRDWVSRINAPVSTEDKVAEYFSVYAKKNVLDVLYGESQKSGFDAQLKDWFKNTKAHASLRLTEAPTFYEWATIRLFQYWNSYDEMTPHTKLCPEGFPISHAPGGAADLEISYSSLKVVVEATMVTGAQQVDKEGPRIKRHYLKSDAGMGVFIAPKVHEDMANFLAWIAEKDAVDFIALETRDIEAFKKPAIEAGLLSLKKELKDLRGSFGGAGIGVNDWKSLCLNPEFIW